MKFLTLDDTPDSYADKAGKGIKVSGDEIALEFSEMKPDAHASRHQTTGQDQIDHGGLSGLGDDDHPLYLKISSVYPIGALYLTTLAANPGTYIGFGTWAAFGAGKTLVGLNAAESEFNTVEKVGGSKTHALSEGELAAHIHTVNPPATASGAESHYHTHPFTSGGRSADHTHLTPRWRAGGGGGNIQYNAAGFVLEGTGEYVNSLGASADHTHSGTTGTPDAAHGHTTDIPEFNSGSKGSGTAHNNLQPYIVVYMWKRTA